MWNLNYKANEPIYKTEIGSQTLDNSPVVAKAEVGGGRGRIGNLELADRN